MVEFYMVAIGELINYPKHTILGKKAQPRAYATGLQTLQARRGGRETRLCERA